MLHNAKDSTEKLAPVAHQHVSAPGEGACCARTRMHQEVTTNQALTPPHGMSSSGGPSASRSFVQRSERAAPHPADPWRAQPAARRRQAE